MGDKMDEEAENVESLDWSYEAEDRAAFNSIVGALGTCGFSMSPDRKKRADYFDIVGIDDDVSMSTIANDTVNGSILHSSFVESPPPVIPANTTPPKKTNKEDFTTPPKKKNFTTPPKKKTSRLDSDEVTQPETPQSEHGQTQFNTVGVPRMTCCSLRMKRIICISYILGCIMLGAIGVLSYAFYDMHSEPESSASDLDSVQKDLDADSPDFDFSPLYNSTSNAADPDEAEEQTPAGTQAPADPVPTNLRTSSPTQSPTTYPTIAAQPQFTPKPTNLRPSSPTQSPITYPTAEPSSSRSPTKVPIISNFDLLLEAVSLISPNSTDALNKEFSDQRVALQWLSIDPNLSEYSKERIVQRWVMATFFLAVSGKYLQPDGNETQNLTGNSTLDNKSDQTEIPVEENTMSGWMTYTDECTWYSREETYSCSEDGKLLDIHLEDIGLVGVLPPEISLLSDSLERIYLSSNEIHGVIPSELGLLTNLLRLQLTANSLEGTIPPQLGFMENLRVLGIGRNQIGGTLPSELGLLSNLGILGLETNRLNGTIPAEYAGMTYLTVMSLKNNELSGTVPSELGRLSSLSTLTIHDNNLRGQVPSEVCNIAIFDVLKADCDEISCPCCTACREGGAPFTPPPTPDLSVAPTSRPTLSPSSAPSASLEELSSIPTSAPTECPSTVMSEKSCYLVGEPLVFEFHMCDGADSDLISLYKDDASFSFTEANFWTRTCGLPDCRATLGDNVMSFDNLQPYQISFSTWPITSGSYTLRLLRVTPTGAIAPYAESTVIEISEQCN